MDEKILGESSDDIEEIMAEEEPKPSMGPQLIIHLVSDFVASNGWFLFLGALAIYFIWTRYLKSKWESWKARRDEQMESARYHKDPDLATARLQAMEAARQKMQAAYNAAASVHIDKMKEKEEQQRLEKIQDWERHQKGLGYRSKTKVQEHAEVDKTSGPKAQSKLKNNDYNPLMGSSGGSFRPPKRSACGGGGCG